MLQVQNTNASIYLKQRAMNQHEYMYMKRAETGSEYSKTKVSFEKKESRNKLGGDLGETVSLLTQTSPYFQLREKLKCIEHIGKGKAQLITSP